MNHNPPNEVFGPAVNRIGDVMAHTTRYAFRGSSRLAADAGISPSAASRIINGKRNPSHLIVARIAAALSRELGVTVHQTDLIAENGDFRTKYCCDVCGCRGCLPEESRDQFGNLLDAFQNVRPGHWVTSKYPNGFPGKEAHA